MKLRKGKAATCGTNHTSRNSRPVPPACPAPGSGRGWSGAEPRGTQCLSQHPLPSCPRWRGAQHPGSARSGGGKPRTRHRSGQAACSPLEGCLCSLLQQVASGTNPSPTPPAARGPPRPRQVLRHEMRPSALPRDYFTKAELDWHAFLKDSQALPIKL